jgi:putative hydrolase of the HAD superfamily
MVSISHKKAIIFDLGNVLFRFDPMIMTTAIISEPEDAALVADVAFDRLYWNRLDDGSITDEEVIAGICSRLPSRLHAQAEQVYRQWYAHMPEIAGMRELLLALKREGKPLYLLSNISIGFEMGYQNVPAIASMLSVFDGRVFSGSLGMVKPQKQIFEYLLDKFGLFPEDCVFIDDSEINIAGAAAAGIDGILFTGDAAAISTALLDRPSP